ncbi:hypothetical protein HDV00_002317 [Rhizophlyctis rosea]|nr:hypothetical protein HDV00_002317 [Rhizophlyctis rosea]
MLLEWELALEMNRAGKATVLPLFIGKPSFDTAIMTEIFQLQAQWIPDQVSLILPVLTEALKRWHEKRGLNFEEATDVLSENNHELERKLQDALNELVRQKDAAMEMQQQLAKMVQTSAPTSEVLEQILERQQTLLEKLWQPENQQLQGITSRPPTLNAETPETLASGIAEQLAALLGTSDAHSTKAIEERLSNESWVSLTALAAKVDRITEGPQRLGVHAKPSGSDAESTIQQLNNLTGLALDIVNGLRDAGEGNIDNILMEKLEEQVAEVEGLRHRDMRDPQDLCDPTINNNLSQFLPVVQDLLAAVQTLAQSQQIDGVALVEKMDALYGVQCLMQEQQGTMTVQQETLVKGQETQEEVLGVIESVQQGQQDMLGSLLDVILGITEVTDVPRLFVIVPKTDSATSEAIKTTLTTPLIDTYSLHFVCEHPSGLHIYSTSRDIRDLTQLGSTVIPYVGYIATLLIKTVDATLSAASPGLGKTTGGIVNGIGVRWDIGDLPWLNDYLRSAAEDQSTNANTTIENVRMFDGTLDVGSLKCIRGPALEWVRFDTSSRPFTALITDQCSPASTTDDPVPLKTTNHNSSAATTRLCSPIPTISGTVLLEDVQPVQMTPLKDQNNVIEST